MNPEQQSTYQPTVGIYPTQIYLRWLKHTATRASVRDRRDDRSDRTGGGANRFTTLYVNSHSHLLLQLHTEHTPRTTRKSSEVTNRVHSSNDRVCLTLVCVSSVTRGVRIERQRETVLHKTNVYHLHACISPQKLLAGASLTAPAAIPSALIAARFSHVHIHVYPRNHMTWFRHPQVWSQCGKYCRYR